MVGIIDYGVGNLFSLQSSFRAIGEDVLVSNRWEDLEKADKLVLPGVGAFEDAACKLRASGLDRLLYQQVGRGVPLLGICLGMQLLFEKSYEYGVHTGLGLLMGEVVPMNTRLPLELKVPHMGWNQLMKTNPGSRLLRNIKDEAYVYFVHSYFASGCSDSLAAVTNYGIEMTAAVEKDNVFGCQFHPEKSGAVGLSILESFCKL